MLGKNFAAQSWRRRLLAVPLMVAAAVAVNAGAAGFVPGIAQASPADRQQGFEDGRQEGYQAGLKDGYNHAYNASYKVGLGIGIRRGYVSPSDYEKGWDDGYHIGYDA